MKIAIPTRDNAVDDHFGHCEKYTLFTIDNNKKVVNTEILPSPEGCGCKSDIAAVLRDQGVTLLLAGSMGNGAQNVLNKHGIDVIRGCKGAVTELVAQHLQGSVFDSGVSCDQHGSADHVCSH